MRRYWLTVLLSVTLLASCGESKEESLAPKELEEGEVTDLLIDDESRAIPESASKKIDSDESAIVETDYAGLYEGVLPCADCPGIQVSLELDYDDAYTRTLAYFSNRKDPIPEPLVESGAFTWDENEQKIRLEGAEGWHYLLVDNGRLEVLDLEGNEIDSTFDYSLYKVKSEAGNGEAFPLHDDGHNAENALSYAGVYQGVYPCADCEGIELTVTLDYDERFKLKRRYLGDSEAPFEAEGLFTWDQSGSIITLEGVEEYPLTFQVAEGALISLDQSGKPIESATGADYSLKMIEQH